MAGNNQSLCPIASSLGVFGDKWTLVILRDMLNGKVRYSQFLDSPEHITTNVLATRLVQMESFGLVRKRVYQPKPQRFEYILTEKGRMLHPVLQEICRWGNHFMPETWVPPEHFMQPVKPKDGSD